MREKKRRKKRRRKKRGAPTVGRRKKKHRPTKTCGERQCGYGEFLANCFGLQQ
jgi:hypothetical protein